MANFFEVSAYGKNREKWLVENILMRNILSRAEKFLLS